MHLRGQDDGLQGVIEKAPKATLNTIDSSSNTIQLMERVGNLANDIVQSRASADEHNIKKN
jgi:hypothetical protein